MEKIKACAKCGHEHTPEEESYMKRKCGIWWFLVCPKCHHCSASRMLLRWAIKVWNREERSGQ